MNNDAKIQLSPAEMELVQNAGWLLTKNTIIDKVYTLFGDISEKLRQRIIAGEFLLPAEVVRPSPKISRGENYQGLPWVMLDYPRLFSKEEVFAVRVFFWWGNFFSVTLHLKGSYLQQHKARLLEQLPLLEQNGFHICTSNDEWRHEFTTDNYVSVREVGAIAFERILTSGSFCRLSVQIPLEQWEQVKKVANELYTVIFTVMDYQLPSR